MSGGGGGEGGVVCVWVSVGVIDFLGAVITGIVEEVGAGAAWGVRCGRGLGDVVILSYTASSGWRLTV